VSDISRISKKQKKPFGTDAFRPATAPARGLVSGQGLFSPQVEIDARDVSLFKPQSLGQKRSLTGVGLLHDDNAGKESER